MIKRFAYIFLMLITLSSFIFGSEYTDELLDESMVEFSEKNYDKSLEIINEVLELEPENSTALLYKSTIEDVIKIDQEEAENNDIESDITSELQQVNSVEDSNDSSNSKNSNSGNLLDISTSIFNTSDNKLTITQNLDIVLGKPVIDFKIISKSIDYNILNINFETFPAETIFNIDSYRYDFSAGYRLNTFDWSSKDSGYFDIKIGASNFQLGSQMNVVPYIGFDTKVNIFKPFSDNDLLENLWLGGSGSIYSFNDETLNNFSIEFSAGLEFGNFYIGGVYSYTNLNSEDLSQYNLVENGIVLGFNL